MRVCMLRLALSVLLALCAAGVRAEPYFAVQTGQKCAQCHVNGTGGGMFEMPGAPIAWVPYAAVGDVAKSTEKARSLGAQILKEKSEVPGMGWFSIFRDPTGALIALWEPKPKAMPRKAKAKPRKAAKAKAKTKAKRKARRR